MAIGLREKFQEKAEALNAEIKTILKEHGNDVIGEVTLSQVYQGMRGITGLVSETSLLDAHSGIRFRGYTIAELREKLPRADGGTEPLPEGLMYLMLTGEFPTKEDVDTISSSLVRRSHVPTHAFKAIDALPLTAHPMTMFVSAIMALQTESKFAKEYHAGMNKKDYWIPTLTDSLDLIACLPRIAAYIYRRKYRNNIQIQPDNSLDWAANFAHLLGFEHPTFKDMLRMYLTIHADHEGGNVSAHTTHLVGSALSDPYLAFAAGMNGLAGPLHGLANQEIIRWVLTMRSELNTEAPSKEQILEYVEKTLAAGKVIPGFGHAVLRVIDPRYTAQADFVRKHNLQDDPLIQTIWNLVEVVPPYLKSLGKVKNPYPNVDCHSGALLIHFGLVEHEFYTVLFGVSRALGVLSSLVWDRALGFPIERPKSVTTESVKRWLEDSSKESIWGE